MPTSHECCVCGKTATITSLTPPQAHYCAEHNPMALAFVDKAELAQLRRDAARLDLIGQHVLDVRHRRSQWEVIGEEGVLTDGHVDIRVAIDEAEEALRGISDAG